MLEHSQSDPRLKKVFINTDKFLKNQKHDKSEN